MKLRNKKTGEIVELKLIQVNDKYLEDHEVNFLNGKRLTLKLLTDSFDDVKEPLIKDEKIRKAVKAWAELHELESVFYFAYTIHTELSYLKDKDTGVVIDIVALPELEDGVIYTITELCGEEEE